MFTQDLLALSRDVLDLARTANLTIVTAESCTGGLIAGLLTEIPGSSDVFERGFVTYSNEAKEQLLGVPDEMLAAHGAVSHEVAYAMAVGALRHSQANFAVAVTGIAGPGGATATKPVGRVYIAVAGSSSHIGAAAAHHRGDVLHYDFGDIGRSEVRLATVDAALRLLLRHF